jgi:hypothetical protein
MFQIWYSYWRLMVVISTVGIMGCSTFRTEPVTVIKTEYSYITIPNELLKDCEISTPPSKTEYMSAGDKGRESLLINHSVTLNKHLKDCNSQMGKARDFQRDMLKKLEVK